MNENIVHNESGAAGAAPPSESNPEKLPESPLQEENSKFHALVDPQIVSSDDIAPAEAVVGGGNLKAIVPLAGLSSTPEMQQWLTDNREDYEFYLLHAMMHDPLKRNSLLAVPVTPDDFRREEYELVVRGLIGATKIMGVIGSSVAAPPSEEFMKTYVESAARAEGSDDEMTADAMALVRELQKPSYSDQHYCVGPYFEAWYGSIRAKQAARKLLQLDIPDVDGILEKVHTAIDAARQIDGDRYDCEFNFDQRPEPPKPILKLGDHMVSTAGNITNLQGPPKAAKSAVIGAAIAATLKQSGEPADLLGFTSDRPAGRAVCHFDTEQSTHAHDALLRRAYSRANQREKVSWLRSYCLTGMEPATCWDYFERKLKAAAEEHGGIMLVIIDGIADFCNDPNDAEECFGLVRKLNRLAGEYGCVVLTVLHENPGGSYGKTRGHLGSQLERKAETSLRLKKDAKTGITVMWADSARHCFIPQGAGWRFHWCDNAKMHVSLPADAAGTGKADKKSKFAKEISEAFGENEILSYTDLTARITEVTNLALSTAKSRIPEYLAAKLLEQDADEKYHIVRAKHSE